MSCKCSSETGNGKVDYQYAVKLVCGVIKPPKPDNVNTNHSLPPGEYKTKVNIHNFSRCDCVTFRWKVAIGEPHLKVGPISDFSDVTLCADEALEIDCSDIRKKFGDHLPDHVEGWVVIESPSELDVVAVYGTAQAKDGPVNAFHTERVNARCLSVCEDFHLNISTGVSEWEVAGPFPGQAPAGSAFTVATLGLADGNWTALPDSLWIHPPGGNYLPEGVYTYRLRFKLCSGFKDPDLSARMFADYFANAYLNGHLISSPLQTNGPNYPTAVPLNATGFFKSGVNELIVLVTNKEKGTTGLALHGDIAVANGLCAGEPMPLLCCPNVEYMGYLERFPWESSSISHAYWNQGWQRDGDIAGTTGEHRRMEKIRIQLYGCVPPGMGIKYTIRNAPLIGQAHWIGPVVDGQDLGFQHERIEMIKIELVNAPLQCHICYRVHIRHSGWSSWVHEGDIVGSSGENHRIEAMEIKFC